MNAAIDPTRLYDVLNRTNIKTKDPVLYQLLYNLIGNLVNLKANSSSGSGGGGGGTTNITNIIQQLLDSNDGNGLGLNEDLIIPGPTGPKGDTGALGPILMDLEEPDPLIIPGPKGDKGDTGASGDASSPIVFLPDIFDEFIPLGFNLSPFLLVSNRSQTFTGALFTFQNDVNINGITSFGGDVSGSFADFDTIITDDLTVNTNPLTLNSGQLKFPSTQNPSTNANTLDDYEEGTWTPVDASGAGLSFTTAFGHYVKIGQMVFASGRADYPATASGLNAFVGGLPFTVHASSGNAWGAYFSFTTFGSYIVFAAISGTTTIEPISSSGVAETNANMSGKILTFTIIYRANQ
jgi:hypothetical protein